MKITTIWKKSYWKATEKGITFSFHSQSPWKMASAILATDFLESFKANLQSISKIGIKTFALFATRQWLPEKLIYEIPEYLGWKHCKFSVGPGEIGFISKYLD